MANKQVTGVYGGRTAEERRTERRQRLLEAGLDVLASSGWAATTVRQICTSAGLNTRYFYECFEGLEELVLAVFDWIIEESIATTDRAMAKAKKDPRSQVRAGIVAAVSVLISDPRRARVIATEAMGSHQLTRRRLRLTHYLVRLLAAAGAELNPEADRTVTAVRSEALAGGIAGIVLAWIDGRLRVKSEELPEHAAQFVDETLFADVSTRESSGGRSAVAPGR